MLNPLFSIKNPKDLFDCFSLTNSLRKVGKVNEKWNLGHPLVKIFEIERAIRQNELWFRSRFKLPDESKGYNCCPVVVHPSVPMLPENLHWELVNSPFPYLSSSNALRYNERWWQAKRKTHP